MVTEGRCCTCESTGGKQRGRCMDQLSGTGWNEGEKGSYLTKDRKIQFRCVLAGISCCRGFPVTKTSQRFTVGLKWFTLLTDRRAVLPPP